jgi:hypothetical protein
MREPPGAALPAPTPASNADLPAQDNARSMPAPSLIGLSVPQIEIRSKPGALCHCDEM